MFREMPKFKPDELLEYLRKSRSDDPNLSVEEVLQKHEGILSEWADRYLDAPIPTENIYREVVSGETIAGRPEVQKMLKRIESSKIKAILVVDAQRLSRGDLEDCGRLIKLLRYTHTMVITPYYIYDLEDEHDREAFERELKKGNDYLEYSKKIMGRGKLISAQDGNYIGSVAPYGYKKCKVTVGKKKCPTLQIDEDEAMVVRLIYNLYVNESLGASKICQRLTEMGIYPPIAKRWNPSVIRGILSNEHYMGKIRYYYTVTTHKVKDQQIRKTKELNKDYMLFDGKHDAIISEELFNKAQKKRGSLPKYKVNYELVNPLASLFFCKCGNCMKYSNTDGVPRYICSRGDYCETSSVQYTELIADVCSKLEESIADFSVMVDTSNDDLIKQSKDHIELLQRKIADIEIKELGLWQKYSEDEMPKAIFEKLKEKYEEEKKLLETALERAYQEVPVKVDYQEKIATFRSAVEALRDDSISAEAKNKLLKACIERIEYSRKPSKRMKPDEAKRLGVTTVNGWYRPDYELDMYLLV